ncbi:unnamed protein product [Caenorhabditis sp. 36 PRJEB53466]|nr:unnamed protein product [Caenorhabditis sp. 36 PRJEB53466]
MDDPSMMPDLSHLSAEEREIIEQVFKRQRDEEAKETQMSQKATEELSELDKQINERKETSKKLIGTQDDAICQICQKTKFADGIGHKCFYCQLRSCARCGGRAQSKNKAIWACSLCQKRQQILAKTGKWFQPEEPPLQKISVSEPSPSPQPLTQTAEQAPQTQQQQRQAEPPDKMHNQNYQHQDQMGMPIQPNQHPPVQMMAPNQHPQQQNQHPNMNSNSFNQVPNNHQQMNNRRPMQHQQSLNQQQHPQNQNQNQNQNPLQNQNQNQNFRNQAGPNQHHQHHQNQRPNDNRNMKQHPQQPPTQQQQQQQNTNQFQGNAPGGQTQLHQHGPQQQPSHHQQRNHNKSQQQQQPSTPGVRACPPNDDHLNRVKNRLHRQLRSMSSSEEDIIAGGGGNTLKMSTSAVVAAGGKTAFHDDMGASNVQRLSEECNSEKDLLRYIYGDHKNADSTSSSGPVGPGMKSKTHVARDEVVEWNGQSLQNATYEQVYDSIAASRYDTSVELIVSRSAIIPGGDDFLNLTTSQMSSSTFSRAASAYPPQYQRQLPNPELFLDVHPALQSQLMPHSQSAVFPHNNTLTSRNRSTSSYYYTDVPDLGIPNIRELPDHQSYGTGHIFGRIEISFVYSHHDRQLSIALIQGFDLPPRSDGAPRNPYVKIFLLPDRSEKSRRQSAVIAETLMPAWNEIFTYSGLTEPMLMQRVLELTVWDYDKFGTNSFLGETLIDLASMPLDGEHSLMCVLVDMDDDNPLRTRLKLRKASYNAPTRRPQSELNYYDHSSNYYNHISQNMDRNHHHDEENDEYIDDDELENDIDLASGGAARKSRAYRREKGMYGHGYSDWTQNHARQSGYTSDHSYGRQTLTGRAYNRRQQRRPRSATALSQMEREEMYDPRRKPGDEDDYSMRDSVRHGSQYYLSDQPLYEDGRYKISQGQMMPQPPQHNQQQQPHPSTSQAHHQHPMQPGIQQQQQGAHQHIPPQQNQHMMPPLPAQGYYSDGSETLSMHSTNSMPTTLTTINRRNMVANNSNASNDTTSFEETPTANTNRVPIKEAKQSSLASSSSVGNSGGTPSQSNSNNAGSTMKERKKSLMTRFIPGRGAEGKRTGFARSEEVGIPGNLSSDRLAEPTPPFLKQASKESTDSAHSDNWLPVLADGPLGTFVDNLGPGQVVGRQVLASPVLGEIQIGLMAGRSGIDVEIIKAKNLVVKPGGKVCPAPYVKVYLMEGKQCVAKAKTNAATKTTSPLFQQHLIFNDNPKNKTLQVTVLGDYGRMERKVFMGISQIRLQDLELGPQPLIGWYKLFHSSSLAGTGPVRKDSDVSVGGAQQ